MKLLKKFLNPKNKFANTISTFGISEDEKHYCLVQKDADKFNIYWQDKPYAIESLLQQIVTQGQKFTVIRTVPYEYIWHKPLFLANTLTSQQIHQRVLYFLEHEQPLTLDELYFDYQITSIPQSRLNKLNIYALRKNFAHSLLSFPNTVLDSELYCYIRGLLFLLTEKEPVKEMNNLSFKFKNNIYCFSDKKIEIHHEILADTLDLSSITFSDDVLNPELYITALGATLWQMK